MNYRFNALALEELRTAAQYYESRRAGLGARFLAEINSSIQTVLEAAKSLVGDRTWFSQIPAPSFPVRIDLSPGN
jgi:hypothetical protein